MKFDLTHIFHVIFFDVILFLILFFKTKKEDWDMAMVMEAYTMLKTENIVLAPKELW